SPRRDNDGSYPIIMERGKGSWLWDHDKNSYLDFTAATGTILLGYSHSGVNYAVRRVIGRGNIFPTQLSNIQIELASKLVELIPCADRVQFFKTGSEACSAAIRLCRTYTRREMILSSGYHGWHDWQLNIYPGCFPDNLCINFGYNLNMLEDT